MEGFLHAVSSVTIILLLTATGYFCAARGWMGRHSLLLYLLHQPVIYGVLTMVFLLLRRGGGAL